jgi:hypothetical protein
MAAVEKGRYRMRISKNPSLPSMKALVKGLSKKVVKGSGVVIQIETRNYSDPRFGVYFPGIAEYDWEYFETWDTMVAACLKIINKKGAKE